MSATTVLVLALLAALVTCSLEVRRTDRRHLASRIAATLIAVASLVGLALEPALPRRVSDARAVLVTEGVSAAAARRIADSVAAREILEFDHASGDLAALRRRYPDLAELVVAGWGLSAADLARAGNLRISFVPAPLPNGIRSVVWPSRTVLGEVVALRGAADPGAWVHLAVHGGAPDSTQTGADGRFELRFTPRAPGLRTFELRSSGAVDTGAVDVRLSRPPAVLVLEGTPGFELAHLRRWLARRGGRVAARTTVSRGRVRTAALNGAPIPGRELSPEALREFDIVVMDAAAARTLSSREIGVLREAVRRDGMGVLLVGSAPRLDGLPMPRSSTRSGARTVRIRGSGSAELLPPVTVEAWTPIAGERGAAILEDNAGGAIAAWEASGTGRVGVSAVRNPSRWLLEGDQAAYDRYWMTILASLGRPLARWRAPAALPAETGRPLSLAWPGRLDTVVIRGAGTVDTLFPAAGSDSLAWNATWWPRLEGEYRAEGPGDTLRIRAVATGSWRAARAAERTRATTLHAALHPGAQGAAGTRVSVPIAPWIFMALFTGAAGWLWWERRRTAPGRIAPLPGEKEGRTGVG